MVSTDERVAFRGEVVHFVDDPETAGDRALEHFADGLLLVRGGRVEALMPWPVPADRLPAGTRIEDWRGKLILPGFVDTHTHFPQIDVIACGGESLLEWLQGHVYPAEQRLADAEYAREVARFFIDELLRNGTTCAMVFGTAHAHSADAIFEAALERSMRLIAGKVMMDRDCPEGLRDTAQSSYEDSAALIERWHGRDRLGYAVTPRFALTSSERQLEFAGRLLDEYPGVWLQTHLAESREEVRRVAEVYPWSRDYLGVYERFGLVREGSIFAHCIHQSDDERARMAAAGVAMSFCPSSNLFLGSGLFDLGAASRGGLKVGLGTDVGAGTSVSLLRTIDAAATVTKLGGGALSALRGLYLATLGGARALGLEARAGSFATGTDADVVVLDPAATPLLLRRTSRSDSLADRLMALSVLGDDRAVAATYVLGRPAWRRDG